MLIDSSLPGVLNLVWLELSTPLRRFAAPAVRDDAPVVQAFLFRASREYLCTSRYSCHGSVYYFVRVYMQVSI